MSYIIPIGNGSFVSAKNGWFCVSCGVTCDYESLGYYLWIMVGYRVPRVPGYLTRAAAHDDDDENKDDHVRRATKAPAAGKTRHKSDEMRRRPVAGGRRHNHRQFLDGE